MKELIEGMKYNNFRIGTHGLGSNPNQYKAVNVRKHKE